MHTVATVLWCRLDSPGHDACRLEHNGKDWQLDGAAVFRHGDGRLAQLHYRVRCDSTFHTQWGTVRGWIGSQAIDLSVRRDAHGGWRFNDEAVPELGHCTDLDLGFTPATNLLPLRRMHLGIGESVEAPAAWLDLDGAGLRELVQRYDRRSETDYGYAAERFDYRAVLGVSPDGFVLRYPGLWDAER